jgi:hypothetical protein
MSDSIFKKYQPSPNEAPVRDYEDETQVIRQGLDPKIVERMEKAERGELKSKLAAILDRGIVQDRLSVELPDDTHGEWVRNDPLEISRLQTLGFTVDDKYASKRAIHSDGTSGSIVGDVIHMICPKEVKELIDEIRVERMVKEHAGKKKGKTKVHKEEEQFQEDVDRLHSAGVSGFTSSTERTAGNKELADIVQEIDKQTKKFE